ncbi:MAG: hypothetical protein JWN04_5699 [Myxococcaceae bacterium]|nr:hypothetical protein [Myxococcaceae bacterium]
MNSLRSALVSVPFFSSALLLGAACDSGSSSDTTAAQLAATEASLTGVVGSNQAVTDAAKTCFDTYLGCKQTAGADTQTCRDALKACLPAEAPLPSSCSTDAGVRADDGNSDSDESAEEALAGDGGAHAGQHQGGSADGDSDGLSDESAEQDGGMKGKGHGKGGGKHGGRAACGHPDVPAGRLEACRDTATTSVASGADSTQVASDHKQCVKTAFADRVSTLCQKANELCARADAVQASCSALTSACTAAQTPAL